MIDIACVHGRFQPPHMEHLEYILSAKSRCRHLIVGITQYDVANLKECNSESHRQVRVNNPLTFEERSKVITQMLIGKGIDLHEFSFLKFPIDQPELLNKVLSKNILCFTTICDEWNVEKIKRLKEFGYEVEVLWERWGTKTITSTEIRQSIISGNDIWKKLVTDEVAVMLLDLNIRDRLIKLCDTNTI